MFTKDNIISVRYTNPENDTVEVLYKSDEDGKIRPYIFPSRPTKSLPWETLRAANWTTSRVKDSTVTWIKDQNVALYGTLQKYIEPMITQTVDGMQKDYDAFVEKTNDEMRKKYDSAVSDMSASVRTGTSDTSLYDILKSPTDEQIFQLKVSILEDKSTFKDLTKTAEKTKRREIRKCKTVKELLQYL